MSRYQIHHHFVPSYTRIVGSVQLIFPMSHSFNRCVHSCTADLDRYTYALRNLRFRNLINNFNRKSKMFSLSELIIHTRTFCMSHALPSIFRIFWYIYSEIVHSVWFRVSLLFVERGKQKMFVMNSSFMVADDAFFRPHRLEISWTQAMKWPLWDIHAKNYFYHRTNTQRWNEDEKKNKYRCPNTFVQQPFRWAF